MIGRIAGWLHPSLRNPREVVTVSGWGDLGLYFFHLLKGWRTWWSLGLNDIKMQFVGTILGLSWPFLQMFMLLLVIGVIYGILLKQDVNTLVPFLAAGLAMWQFLALAMDMGSGSFIVSEGYIKQISVPKCYYVLRQLVSAHFRLLMALLAFFIVKFIFDSPFGWGTLMAIPGLFLFSVFCSLLAFILAYLNTRFRDIQHLNTIFIQTLFYATPVIYPASILREAGKGYIADYNPFYHLLELPRAPLIDGSIPSLISFIVVGVMILLAFLACCWTYL